jgi:hypothetical protein
MDLRRVGNPKENPMRTQKLELTWEKKIEGKKISNYKWGE